MSTSDYKTGLRLNGHTVNRAKFGVVKPGCQKDKNRFFGFQSQCGIGCEIVRKSVINI